MTEENKMVNEVETNTSDIETVNKRLVPDMKTIYLKTDKIEISRKAFKTYKEYKEDLQQFVPYSISELEEYYG